MIVMFVLIGISIVLASGFLLAFIWAVRTGQFEDTTTPSLRILFPDSTSNNIQNNIKITKNLENKNESRKVSI